MTGATAVGGRKPTPRPTAMAIMMMASAAKIRPHLHAGAQVSDAGRRASSSPM